MSDVVVRPSCPSLYADNIGDTSDVLPRRPDRVGTPGHASPCAVGRATFATTDVLHRVSVVVVTSWWPFVMALLASSAMCLAGATHCRPSSSVSWRSFPRPRLERSARVGRRLPARNRGRGLLRCDSSHAALHVPTTPLRVARYSVASCRTRLSRCDLALGRCRGSPSAVRIVIRSTTSKSRSTLRGTRRPLALLSHSSYPHRGRSSVPSRSIPARPALHCRRASSAGPASWRVPLRGRDCWPRPHW